MSLPKIKIIPIKLPFLPTLADYVWKRFKQDPPDLSDVLLIFPSQRNKFYFRKELLNSSGKSGVIPPTMFTIQELIRFLFERLGGEQGKVLNKIERNLILKDLVSSLKIEHWKDLDFLRFISIGDRLLAFFDELKREDVSLDKIEDLKERLHFPERYVENELTILRKIWTEYRKVLTKSGYTDTEYVCEIIKRGFGPEILSDYSYILISGLLATTEFEKEIIQRILSNLPSELVLHSDPIITEHLSVTSPYYHHNRLFVSLGASAEDIETDTSPHKELTPTIHITRHLNKIQEVLFIREMIKRLVNRYEPHQIAVILTDESDVIPITSALKEVCDFNLSIGISLSQTLLYSFLSLLRDAVKSKFHHKDFFAFIRHPLLKNLDLQGDRARPIIYKIERKMIKDNKVFFLLDDFKGDEYSPVTQIIQRFADKIRDGSCFSLYILQIEEILSEILSLNPEFLFSNILGTKEFLKHLQEMKRLVIRENLFPTGIEKIEFILKILGSERHPVQGNPFKGVQLIGVLEARNLNFDVVLLPSMNEGIFPKKSEKDLFLPPQLREEAGLPYDKERENLYYYYFTQLISCKKEVFISWVEREDRDVCSRFVTLLRDNGLDVEESPIVFKKEKRRPGDPVQKDEALINKLEEMRYSPSSLKDYRVCSYRFYLRYILGIKEQGTIIESAGALEWGKIIHEALQKFYKEDFPSYFREEDLKRAEKIAYSRLEESLKKMGRLNASSIFDLEIYKRYIKRFLGEEIERFRQGYRVASVEETLDYEISLNSKTLKLKGNIDRIDRLDGKYYIIDYKTGQEISQKFYQVGKEFTEFQLPLYALMFSHEEDSKIGGLLYYYISKKKTGIEDIMDENYIIRFRNEILIPTICELIDPDIPFVRTDNKRRCRICAFNQFC